MYSKDFSKLIHCPYGNTKLKFHSNLKIVGTEAFSGTKVDTIVIPWGVTTIEKDAFDFALNGRPNVILPDTVTSMQQTRAGGKDNSLVFTYSKSNTAVAAAIAGKTDYFDRPIANPVDSLYEYYPDHVSPPQKPGTGESVTSKPTGDPANPSSSPDDAKPTDKPTGGTSKPTEPSKPTEQSKPASSTPEPSKPASSLPAESSEAEISSESSIPESAELSESAAESSEESSEEVSRVEAPEVESSGGDFTWLLPIVIALIAAVAVLAVILIRVLKGK